MQLPDAYIFLANKIVENKGGIWISLGYLRMKKNLGIAGMPTIKVPQTRIVNMLFHVAGWL